MSREAARREPEMQSGWRQRLHEEEMNGFAFAFTARSIALGVVVLWVILSSSLTRLPFLLAATAAFFLVGWLAYRSRASRHMLAIQAVCALVDVAIIVLASHLPEDDWHEWALQSWMRRAAFLYLVAYVASSALTFSVKVVLMSGVASMLGLIAGAIWRARRHVERAVQAEAQRGNLGRYFSPNVAERLANDVRALDAGRAQNAAVLFVDAVGSVRRMEALAPEEVIAAVRSFHRRIVPIIFRHDGSIDKFLGDGLMAVFGAPEKTPHDARDAVLCAVEILDAVDRWRAGRIARDEDATTVGIGIHHGPVIQGNVGIADRLEFTTLGDTVNLASRLERMTREHGVGILLSREAMVEAEKSGPLPREIKNRCRDLGVLPIAGHDAPVHVIAIDRLAGA